jgi:outer membrane protein assembly factor BamB
MLRTILPLLVTASISQSAFADWPLSRGDALMSGVGQAKLPDQLDERWTFKTKNAIEGAPAVVNGIVYVGSLDKFLYAIDLKTGKEKWSVKLGAFRASPSVRGDRLYIGDLDGRFYCVSISDGKLIWKFQCDGEIAAGCNFHGENILFGSHDNTLYCIDANGKKVWDVKTEGPVNGSPVVVGDSTFVAGCDEVLHVLDAKTGKELGSVPLGGQAAATAAVHGDFSYVGTMTNQVVAIDWKKRVKAWEFEPRVRAQEFFSSAIVTPDLVIAGNRNKIVYGLDRKTGKPVWTFETDGAVDGSPVVVGSRVYTGCLSNDGNFYVLDLKTGKKIQEMNLDSAVTGSLAVGPDCILVGTDKGTLYCLGAK